MVWWWNKWYDPRACLIPRSRLDPRLTKSMTWSMRYKNALPETKKYLHHHAYQTYVRRSHRLPSGYPNQRRYLHSDIDTLERVALLRGLRAGEFDVLVGINLLREGLDLPEVSLVAILDADKEGFLRSATGLIQTIGRAARNASGKAILYGDRITKSMQAALDETQRRRAIQEQHNETHGVTPQTISKAIREMPSELGDLEDAVRYTKGKGKVRTPNKNTMPTLRSARDIQKEIKMLREKMLEAAGALAFEEAAEFRDEIKALEEMLLMPEFR